MKGQVTVQFNWIYVMVAGAAILLFFIMIITQQKDMSEKRLNYKVMNILENIFTGSTVAENTKIFWTPLVCEGKCFNSGVNWTLMVVSMMCLVIMV